MKIIEAQEVKDFEKLLLFIGSPRTGSTLLGQIINYHPQCLISTESRFATSVIIQGASYEEAIKKIVEMAHEQFVTGLEKAPHFSKTIDRYQPKWLPFESLSRDVDFAKGTIKVVGDKKAGGTTEAFIAKPEAMLGLLASHPNIHLIQIIRNPVNAALSLMKSHKVESFKDACKEIVEKTHAAVTLGNMVSNPYLSIYYEDLLANPTKEIKKILSWLNVEDNASWLDKIGKKVNKSKMEAELPQYRQIATELIQKSGSEEEFKRYLNNWWGADEKN